MLQSKLIRAVRVIRG